MNLAAIFVAKMDEAPVMEVFPHLILGLVMIGTQRDMFAKFLDMKPLTFVSSDIEDAFEFFVYFYKRLHKIGTME